MSVRDEILERKATIKENNQKIYDQGVLDSKKAFENALTNNWTRNVYVRAFSNTNYNGYEFSQPIKPTNVMAQMFYSCEAMTELPKPLDFSEILTTCTDNYANRRAVFSYCVKLKVIHDFNMRAIGGLEEWFSYCESLETIELLRVNEDTVYAASGGTPFYGCRKLQNIKFDGVIGQNIGFLQSPLLTKKSLINIAEHLKDFSSEEGTDNLRTITFHDTIKTYLRDDPEGQIIGAMIANKRWGVM